MGYMESHFSGSDINNNIIREDCVEIISSLPKKCYWGEEEPAYQYQGFWYPQFVISGVIWAQQNFKATDTDILLASFPKCGTTWLKALMFAITNRNSYYPSSSQSHPLLTTGPHDLVPFIESHNDDPMAYFDSLLSSPRLLSTHISYTSLPNSILDSDSGARVVYIARNPKDVLVSSWAFGKTLSLGSWNHIQEPSIQELFELFCNGVAFGGPFWDHVLGYWKTSLENPKKVLFLKYEDMKKDTEGNVKRLAEFMGHPFSLEEETQGVLHEIIKLCSFQNLSNLEVNKQSGNKEFFRLGKVGDSENHLTPEMLKRLEEITKERFENYGLKL